MLGTSASVRDQPASVAVRAWECPRAIWKGAGESTLEVCDSIDVLRLYVSEGVRMLTTYAHIARPIFMCDGWTAEGGPSARPRKNEAECVILARSPRFALSRAESWIWVGSGVFLGCGSSV